KGTKEQTRERRGFVAPDLETVKKQCETKGYPVEEAEAFFLYYDSKGWMVGKNKMVRWPQARIRLRNQHDFRSESQALLLSHRPKRRKNLSRVATRHKELHAKSQ
ncbi:hypothetical protein OAK98_04600, partial [Mariniblastus sp.]|nr:hypothetical protein [Mariniblastus sp.]